MMFVNLFQTLVQNPQMTATEALIRQEEKGALLGPSGSIIQAGLATNLDRELGILEDKGLYDEDSRFLPPASLSGKAVRPTFTGPLDVLRRSAEARDTIQVVTTAMQMAQFDPGVMDNIDSDEALKIVQSAGRSPQRIFRHRQEDAGAKAQQAQAGMAAIATAGKVAKDAVPAAVQARDSGLLDGLRGMLQGAGAEGTQGGQDAPGRRSGRPGYRRRRRMSRKRFAHSGQAGGPAKAQEALTKATSASSQVRTARWFWPISPPRRVTTAGRPMASGWREPRRRTSNCTAP